MSTPFNNTKHGQRAEGQTAMSVSVSEDVKEVLRKLALKEDRSVSNFLNRLLENLLLSTDMDTVLAFLQTFLPAQVLKNKEELEASKNKR